MKVNGKWLVALILIVTIPLAGCGFTQKLKARSNLNKGGKALEDQKYNEATQFFEKAIELDPKLDMARLYLAMAYMSQFVPGSTDPKSQQMAMKAIDTFKEIVAKAEDPKKEENITAMLSIASLYYNLKKYDESKEWCKKILDVDPTSAQAYYRIAVMDYDFASEKTGNQGENIEFLNPEEIKQINMAIEEGLDSLDKALKIRADYFDAMEYQNYFWKEKAKFEKDETAKKELIHKADMVFQKALQLRLKAEQEAAKAPKKMGNR
jgi:tetratricopeptide (TPR) repeat protein